MRHLRLLWDALRSSLWFVPTLFVVGALLLAQGMIELGHLLPTDDWEEAAPRLLAVGPDGARSVLATIAGSMISVAGVAFSITIVALSLASSQYTSRILRNFMADRANQAVLGAFVGIFVYCLWVLRTISQGKDGASGSEGYSFVPVLAVLFAVVLALVGIACLIFFIHHIAASIQAERIILAATDETLAAVERLFPEKVGEGVGQGSAAVRPALPPEDTAWHAIAASSTGYLQSVDGDRLVELASERDLVVRMERPVGGFVVEGSPLVSLADRPAPEEELVNQINALFAVGGQRTIVQDASYGIRQIVDVALKALSPGINDTTTAVSCVEHLSAVMAKIARRQLPSEHRMYRGTLRVIAMRPGFDDMLGQAFDQIRQNAGGNVATLSALVDALAVVAERTDDADRRAAIARQLDLVATKAAATIEQAEDLAPVEATVAALRKKLG
ncbi:MAG: DUF2254 domain-containing protein [Phycisphaerales bacterium]